MQIQSLGNSVPSFKGYDARPLKGFLLHSDRYGLLPEMKKAAEREKINLYYLGEDDIGSYIKINPCEVKNNSVDCWAQDFWTIIKEKLLSCSIDLDEAIKKQFNLELSPAQGELRRKMGLTRILSEYEEAIENRKGRYDAYRKNIDKALSSAHIKGGNLFIVKSKRGADEVIVGSDELARFSREDIKKMYDVGKVHVIPQMDYHLDLFIRPLNDGRILLADDNLMVSTFKNAIKNIVKIINDSSQKEEKDWLGGVLHVMRGYLDNFEHSMSRNPYYTSDETAKVLQESGFEIIRVPGRVFDTMTTSYGTNLISIHNYLNANVFLNKNNEMVYMTGSSNLDKKLGITQEVEDRIGFSFKRAFLDALAPYVDKERVYFISGRKNEIPDVLRIRRGGIHCMCAEIPA